MFKVIPTRPRWVQEKSTAEERAVVDWIHGCLTRRADSGQLDRAADAVAGWWLAKLAADGRTLSPAQESILRCKATELMMNDVPDDPAGWWEFAVMPADGSGVVREFAACLELDWLDVPQPAPKPPVITDDDPF